VAYATLRRGAKPIATFPGLKDAPLNNISIGAYPLLGGTREQLVISATAPRTGHHIIVALQPKMHVIFDNSTFHVAREDLSVADLDNDGVSEIAAESLVGYSSELHLPMSDLPLPMVVFRYNATKGRYLPANRRFKELLLEHLQFKELHLPTRSGSVGDVLDSTLTYIYAGERSKGWVYFDKNYLLTDKIAMQVSLKKLLEKDPVYRYIYGGSRR
jgi:hypothetical protein